MFIVQTANISLASTKHEIHFELKGENGKCEGKLSIPADQGG